MGTLDELLLDKVIATRISFKISHNLVSIYVERCIEKTVSHLNVFVNFPLKKINLKESMYRVFVDRTVIYISEAPFIFFTPIYWYIFWIA